MANTSIRRCAIYTRKSSEEGLEQDYNSLHAQREACEAFIRSQAGEGWRLDQDSLRRRRLFGRYDGTTGVCSSSCRTSARARSMSWSYTRSIA